MKQLLIISGYLDDKRPTGGVTMHVHRLVKRVIEPNVKHVEYCDYKKEGILKQLKKIRKAEVLHTHVSNPLLKLFYVVAGKIFCTKTIITVHGKYGIYGKMKNFIHKLALRWCDVPVLINKESYETVKLFNNRAVFMPAFIPPIKEEEQLNPKMQAQIMKIKGDGKPLFVTNASSRAFTPDGREIYGIDFLVEYFRKHTVFNLVILDPRCEYTPLYEGKLPENVTIFTGLHSFCGLMEYADGVIRNTPTDGDSLSVKEALYYHKRMLATDAVSRPEGVFLFKYSDKETLGVAIVKALNYEGEIYLNEKDAYTRYCKLYWEQGIDMNGNNNFKY